MTAFTKDRIEELLAICAVTTPGPVRARITNYYGTPEEEQEVVIGTNVESIATLTASRGHHAEAMRDARFLAQTYDPQTGYIAALEEIRQLQAEVHRLTQELNQSVLNEQSAYARGARDEYEQTRHLRRDE